MGRKKSYCTFHQKLPYKETLKYSTRAKQEMSNDVHEQWALTLKGYAALEGCHVEGNEVVIEPCTIEDCSFKGARIVRPPYYVFKTLDKPGRAVKNKPKRKK